MGVFCCCPCPEDYEDNAHPTNPMYRHCLCLRYFFHQLFSGHSAPFQRLESQTSPPPTQSVPPLTITAAANASADTSFSETCRLVSRPLPYDTDPRYLCSPREGLVSRFEKSSSHVHDDSQAIRGNGSSSTMENIITAKKISISESEEGGKPVCSESFKNWSSEAYGTGYMITSLEDEDVCPTCLEEYSADNPKIVAKCSHHFHLSCIYEWMERSDTCPVCGKEMAFRESP